jgi:hypothetical protein
MDPLVRGVIVATAAILLEITSIDIVVCLCQQGIPNSMELRSSVKVVILRVQSVMGAFGIGLLQLPPLALLTIIFVEDEERENAS